MSTPSAGRQSVWAVITREVIDTFGSAVAAEFCACPAHRVQVWANGGDPPTSKEQDKLRLLYADAFAEAVKVDALLRSEPRRHAAMFVHRSLRPLGEIDFTRQQTLALDGDGFGGECSGMCGV